MLSFSLGTLCLAGIASATMVRDLRPTETSPADHAIDLRGWTPMPTNMPAFGELVKRQSGTPPSDTCGYMDGDQSYSWTCFSSHYCGLRTDYNIVGCCTNMYTTNGVYSLSGCLYHTTCYDSSVIGALGSSVLSNTLVLKCASAAYPYCMKYTYTDAGYSILDCNKYQSVTLAMAVSYTYVPSVVSSSSILAGGTTTETVISRTTISAVASSASSVASSISAAQSGAQNVPATSSGVDAGAAAAGTTSPTPSASPTPGKVSTGAIVGGVVGGLVVVGAAVGFLILCCLRRRTTKKEAAAAATPATAAPLPVKPPMGQTYYRPDSPSGKAPEHSVNSHPEYAAPPYQAPQPTSPTMTNASDAYSQSRYSQASTYPQYPQQQQANIYPVTPTIPEMQGQPVNNPYPYPYPQPRPHPHPRPQSVSPSPQQQYRPAPPSNTSELGSPTMSYHAGPTPEWNRHELPS